MTILRVALCVLIAFAVASVFTLDTSFGASKFKKSKVTGVKAAPSGEGMVQVSWKKKSGASGYLVYVSAKKKGGFKQRAAAPANASSANMGGLTPGKTLYFKVRAYQNAGGKNKYSKYSKVVKFAIPPSVCVKAVRGTTSQMRVSIVDSVPKAKGYEVYRSANGSYHKIATLSGSVRSFTDSGLAANKVYKYKVRAWTKKKKKKQFTSFSAVSYDITGGNSKIYDLSQVSRQADNKLTGKKILFLGSSVTKGSHSGSVSFVDYLQKRNGIIADKNAVSGTTIATVRPDSYVSRLEQTKGTPDLVVCQLSSNDARTDIKSPKKDQAAVEATDPDAVTLAEAEKAGAVTITEDEEGLVTISEGDQGDEKNGDGNEGGEKPFDDLDMLKAQTNTVEGGIKYIIAYSRYKLKSPVAFYVLPRFSKYGKFDPVQYAQLRDMLLQIQQEWNANGYATDENGKFKIEVLDLWGNPFTYSGEEYGCCYYKDGVHPYKAGYLDKFTPAFEGFLKKIIR